MPKNNEEIIGYHADDGNIYCVECIKKTHDAMKTELEMQSRKKILRRISMFARDAIKN